MEYSKSRSPPTGFGHRLFTLPVSFHWQLGSMFLTKILLESLGRYRLIDETGVVCWDRYATTDLGLHLSHSPSTDEMSIWILPMMI